MGARHSSDGTLFPAGSPYRNPARRARTACRMSRFSTMPPRARRAWGIGMIAFFVVLLAGIAISQWYAVNVNVPRYDAKLRAEHR